MQDEYVEITDQEEAAPVKVMAPQAAPVVLEEEDIEFVKRMENWRRVVLGSLGGGGGGFCAGWAKLYVQTRDERARAKLLKQLGELPVVSSTRTRIVVDELDGWLVEAAVRSLGDYNQRMALQYRYVWRYPEHWIKTKLMLRKSGVRLVLGRAQMNLKNILRNLNSAANILSNNSHAGVDPRPESNDAPLGSASPLENEKALVE